MFWVWTQSFENQGLSVAIWSINATFSTCPMVKPLVLIVFVLSSSWGRRGKRKGKKRVSSSWGRREKRKGECISIHVFREGWAWVEYQEPCCRTKIWFGPTQETVAIISCDWLKCFWNKSHEWNKGKDLEVLIVKYFFPHIFFLYMLGIPILIKSS